VRGEDGALSRAGSLACGVWDISTRLAGEKSAHRVIHVTCHSDNFKLQRALVLVEVAGEIRLQPNPLPSQHIILCSDVEVSDEEDRATNDYPLEDLLKKRQSQMTEPFRIKYDAKTLSEVGVRDLVSATTEAVVKFELLSTDPQSKIKLTVPAGEGSQSSDVRFAGSFVLYNFARLANLVRNFEKACNLGTYPSLPDIGLVDFSLLTDEEEWSILFRYLLQFPLVVREVTSSVCQSRALCCQIKLKKICQFLTQLSHCVSTYYSRVKILMAPEPHLIPLIHARLLLVTAIKRTMYSALQLLAIEPPEQL
jgi:arginyl-tRNA synthetase